MSMKIMFYKGTRKGLNGLYSRGVRFIDKAIFSHCEICFSDGISASSSFIDGGVRFKDISYENKSDWVAVEIPWGDEATARKYFEDHEGVKYDIEANVRFVFGLVRQSESKLFCSEAVAGALGMENPWRITPNALYEILTFMNKVVDACKDVEEQQLR